MLFSVLSWFVQTAIGLGLLEVMLEAADGKNPAFNTLFSKIDIVLILKYFAASIIVGFAVVGGFLLLIIPGIIVANRLSLVGFVLVDKKNIGPVDAVKESWRITEGNVWNLIGLGLYSIGITILGLLALFIGIFVSAAVVTMSQAFAYRKLSGTKPSSGSAPAPSTPAATPSPVV
jgi:uncharacterized membrane protein